MHWSNGRFHESVTVGQKVYITDHKHIAIFGGPDYIGYGEPNINSYMYGKEVGITASTKFFSDSTSGSNLWSKQYIRLEAGSSSANHSSDTGVGIEIVSKNGDTNVKSDKYVKLAGGIGIIVDSTSYGTSLPSTGTEGQIFFKLIS